jgi:hypothetical protein
METQEVRPDPGLARDRFFVRKPGKPGLRRETAPGFISRVRRCVRRHPHPSRFLTTMSRAGDAEPKPLIISLLLSMAMPGRAGRLSIPTRPIDNLIVIINGPAEAAAGSWPARAPAEGADPAGIQRIIRPAAGRGALRPGPVQVTAAWAEFELTLPARYRGRIAGTKRNIKSPLAVRPAGDQDQDHLRFS